MNRRKKEDKFQQQSILEGDTLTCYDIHGSADTCMYLKQVKNVDQNDVIRRGGGGGLRTTVLVFFRIFIFLKNDNCK